MAGIQPLLSGLTAAVLNGAILAGPFFAMYGRPPGVAETAVAGCLCVAVGVEAALSTYAAPRSTGGLDLLNWAQGLGLLATCVAAFLWPGAGVGLVGSVIGGIMILAGGALRCAAISRLGSGFSSGAAPAAEILCSEGVYGWMRHPAEIGMLLIAAGFPFCLAAWPVLATAIPALAVLSWLRTRREDRALAHAFPDSFPTYRRRVRF